MAWTLDKNGVTPSVTLTSAEQGNLNTFMNAVREGTHPKDAAKSWDSDYKQLQSNQYQIRLSKKNRVTFLLEGEVVKILQVGGHT